MAVDFKTFISVVPHVTAVRKPVLFAVVTVWVNPKSSISSLQMPVFPSSSVVLLR